MNHYISIVLLILAHPCSHTMETFNQKQLQKITSDPNKLSIELQKTVSAGQSKKVKQLLNHAKIIDLKPLLIKNEKDLAIDTKTPLMQLAKSKTKKVPPRFFVRSILMGMFAIYLTLPILYITQNVIFGADTHSYLTQIENIQKTFWNGQCLNFFDNLGRDHPCYNIFNKGIYYRYIFREDLPKYDSAADIGRNVSLLTTMTLFFLCNFVVTIFNGRNNDWDYSRYGHAHTIYKYCKDKKNELKTPSPD
jgi:hypothetical protein